MKKTTALLLLAASLMGGSLVWAQVPKVTPVPSPKVRMEKGRSHSATHQFNVQMKEKMAGIGKDLKAGKLTLRQAQDLRVKVKAIRVQELQWMRENGNKELSPSQIDQLTQQLKGLSDRP